MPRWLAGSEVSLDLDSECVLPNEGGSAGLDPGGGLEQRRASPSPRRPHLLQKTPVALLQKMTLKPLKSLRASPKLQPHARAVGADCRRDRRSSAALDRASGGGSLSAGYGARLALDEGRYPANRISL